MAHPLRHAWVRKMHLDSLMMNGTPHEAIWDYACRAWAKEQASHRAPMREPSYAHSAFVLDTPFVKLIMRDANGTVLATQTQPLESEPEKGAFEVDGTHLSVRNANV